MRSTRNDSVCPGWGAATERQLIKLTESLWSIACRHLLGAMSDADYRRELARLLAQLDRAPGAARLF